MKVLHKDSRQLKADIAILSNGRDICRHLAFVEASNTQMSMIDSPYSFIGKDFIKLRSAQHS